MVNHSSDYSVCGEGRERKYRIEIRLQISMLIKYRREIEIGDGNGV